MTDVIIKNSQLPADTGDFDLQALEAAQVGLWQFDIANEIVRLSPLAEGLLQGDSREPPYQRFLTWIHPDDRSPLDSALREAAAEAGQVDVELRRGTEEDFLWLRLRGAPVPHPGATQKLHGVIIDITDRKVIEAENGRLAAIVSSSQDAIIGKTLDGIITDWNKAAEDIFGYSAMEMLGQPIDLLVPEDHVGEAQAILSRIKNGERIEHFETKRCHKSGELIDVSLTVSPVLDESGHLIGASKIARNITDAKQAQQALAEREARLQSVLDSAPDAIIVIDTAGLMQSFSTTAERLFGYSSQEAVGRNVSMLMPPPYRGQHDGYLARYLRTGEKRIIGIGRLVVGLRKNGTTFPMELSVGEARIGNRRLFTGFVRDLTERQEVQRRLQELQAELIHMSRLTALGEMASALAHELNQPLTAAASYLKGVKRLMSEDTHPRLVSAREAVEQAANQVLRAGDIIRRLRDFVARGETDRCTENLPKLIEESSVLALIGVKNTDVKVSFDFGAGAELVWADKVQIQQVLHNLIRNAIEAMQDLPRREITIVSRPVDCDIVEIDVADSGPGIAPEIEARLFQPFMTTKRHGMGVGLSISRTIIEAHGGRLWAEPNPQGGTIFRMTLKRPGAEDFDDAQ